MIVPLWQKYGSGVFLTAVLAGTASVLSYRYGAPAMLLGLLLGMAFHYASDSPQVTAGTELLAGTALRLGVALLGARLAFSDLAQLGWEPIVFLVFAVGTTIVSGVVCARMLGVKSRLGVLTGGSVAICGASAAMAHFQCVAGNRGAPPRHAFYSDRRGELEYFRHDFLSGAW